MANDIIDINVYETVETVEITVNPNLTTVNINKVTSSSGAGTTNLSTTQTASNFTINSDTGDDALVPLGNGTLAGGTLNNYTTAEKNKLAAITGTNTGDQNLQQVLDIEATYTFDGGNYIGAIGAGTVNNRETYFSHNNGQIDTALLESGFIESRNGYFAMNAVYRGRTTAIETLEGNLYITQSNNNGTKTATILFDTPIENTSFVLPAKTIGTSYTIATLDDIPSTTSFVPYTGANNNVDLGLNDITAEKLIKSGGTSSQILAADGSVITQGNNITITGGVISSVGGSGGGGSSVNYYLNGGTSQGTFGGTTYYEFSKTAVIGTGADFSRSSNGYIASFITDVADPSLLLIPAGNWNLEFFFSSTTPGGSPSFYVELYKYDGTTFTLITSSSATPEGITNGTAIDAYFTPLAVPETILTVNDRLAIRVFVNASSKTITLHTQNGHLCEVITTFTAGLTALNGLQAQVQNFATGTTGTDFDIVSSGSTHTFNLPSASATARGVVTTASQTFAGDKTFTGTIGASNLSGSNTGDNATNTQYSGLATSKQDTLQSTVNIKSINGNSILGSGDLTISGTGISSLNGLTGATQTFSATTTTGTGIPAWSSSGTNHQLNIPIAGGATTTGLITGTSQFISGNKVFLDTIQIPVPAGNTTTCIVLGAAGGGSATSQLTIGSTTLYPNAQEMQYVKGITSSVQTQLNSKASIVANITNDVYSDTIVWTGGAAPTVPNHTYSLSQIGNLVTLTINLAYTTAGSSLLTGVAMELPSTAPAPALPSSATAALDVINYGSGALQILNDSPTAAFATNTLLRIKSTGVYEVFITRGAGQYRHAYATIQYFV